MVSDPKVCSFEVYHRGSRQRRVATATSMPMTTLRTTTSDPGAGRAPACNAAGESAKPPQRVSQPCEAVPYPEWTAARLKNLKTCQQWLKSLVNSQFERLFAAFTGLSFCLAWNGPFASAKQDIGNRFCPRSRGLRHVNDWALALCTACRRRNWEYRQHHEAGSRRFRGLCGAPTLWIDLCVGGVNLGRAVLQAPARPLVAARQPPDFRRAICLLRVLVDQAGARLESQQLRGELEMAQRLVRHLEAELTRLRHELHARLPEVSEQAPLPGTIAHPQRIVDQILVYIHEHYRKPMSLGEVAQALDMNASYLSTLFARTTGLAFHAYLDELRLAKAKELLRDPRLPIAQVACECGYASDDWFRHAFKAHTGLSPSEWRQADPRSAAPRVESATLAAEPNPRPESSSCNRTPLRRHSAARERRAQRILQSSNKTAVGFGGCCGPD